MRVDMKNEFLEEIEGEKRYAEVEHLGQYEIMKRVRKASDLNKMIFRKV